MGGELPPGYRLERELGAGATGRVVLAVLLEDRHGLDRGTRVALKLVHPELLRSRDTLLRLRREARVGASVDHPNVVRIHGAESFGEEGAPGYCLVLEYVPGQSLRDFAGEQRTLAESMVRHVAEECVRALVAVHGAGLVHRDLKPENILLTPDHRVRLVDLGSTRSTEPAARISRHGDFVGSLLYSSPEQLRGGGVDVDGRADLHALGIVLFELLTGQHPFARSDVAAVAHAILSESPPPLRTLRSEVSPTLAAVVDGLLRKEPRDRIPTADALLDLLQNGEASRWWESVAAASKSGGAAVLAVGRQTSFHGRSAELGTLHRVWGDVRAGRGRTVLLTGEAGIGKTRLVDAFVRDVRAVDPRVGFLFGAHEPFGSGSAFAALGDALSHRLVGPEIEQDVARRLPDTPRLVSLVTATLQGRSPPQDEERPPRAALEHAFAQLVCSCAADAPQILFVDDLHFGPPESLGLFLTVARAVSSFPVLLVGGARLGLPDAFFSEVQRLETGRVLPVDRLGDTAVDALVSEMVLTGTGSDTVRRGIADLAGGNPFFALEIVRGLAEDDALSADAAGGYRVRKVPARVSVPASVGDVIAERVAGLPQEDREILDVAACVGAEFDPTLVSDALGRPRLATLRRLASLETRHRLVRSRGNRCVFDHHQIHAALYGRLPGALRASLHGALARAVELRIARSPRPDLDVVACRHHVEAGDREGVGVRLTPALDHLHGRFEFRAAYDLVRAALDADDLLEADARTDALVRAGAALRLVRNLKKDAERIVALLEEAVERADRTGHFVGAVNARIELGEALWDEGTFRDRSAAVLTRAVEIAREHRNERLLGLALSACGDVATRSGDAFAGVAALEESVHVLDGVTDDSIRLAARIRLGAALRLAGRPAEAKQIQRACVKSARALQMSQRENSALSGLGITLRQLGDEKGAAECQARCIELTTANGDLYGRGAAHANMATVLHGLGRVDEAVRHAEQAREVARRTGMRTLEAVAVSSLAWAARRRGHPAEALDLSTQMIRLLGAQGQHNQLRTALVGRALDFLMLGRATEGRADAEKALALAQESGSRSHVVVALRILGVVLARGGWVDAAHDHLVDAVCQARQIGAHPDEMTALRALADLQLRRGDRDAVIACFDRARELVHDHAALEMEPILRAVHAAVTRAPADVRAADDLAARLDETLELTDRMEIAYFLWLATGERARIDAAWKHLCSLVRDLSAAERDAAVRGNESYLRVRDARGRASRRSSPESAGEG